MARRLALILVCGLLTVGGIACAPPRVGPTAGAGYVFTLQVADPIIWLGPVDAAVARQFPQGTAVIVQVQDAQGRPVDDVPVTFEVEPGWVSSITLTPAQTRTRVGARRRSSLTHRPPASCGSWRVWTRRPPRPALPCRPTSGRVPTKAGDRQEWRYSPARVRACGEEPPRPVGAPQHPARRRHAARTSPPGRRQACTSADGRANLLAAPAATLPLAAAAGRSSHTPTAGSARTPLARARGPLAAGAATPQWRRAAATAQWPQQRPHLRERSRVTTRGKTCSDAASGNDKPLTTKSVTRHGRPLFPHYHSVTHVFGSTGGVLA